MSMINVSGIPNMGFAGGGGGYFAPSGLGQLGIGDISAYNKAPAIGADQALYNNIFGNFGKATDYYSGLGAAYGRATGGFGGGPPAPQAPPQQVPIESSVWDTGAQPVPPGGGFDMATYLGSLYGGGKGMGSTFNQGTYGANSGSLGSMTPFGGYQPAVQPGMQDFSQLWGSRITPQPPAQNPWGSYFNDVTAPATARPQSSPGGFDMSSYLSSLYGGMGVRGNSGMQAAPQLPDIQKLLGYNPATSAQFAPQPSQNASPFFGAFSQFPGNATPNQYTYQPYTNAQGQTFQPNMPGGFAPQYDVDNPQGALPRNWNSQAGGA